MKPFIYLASLRRTGSKVLSEALTLPPYSFIFREPRLGSRKFRVRPVDVEIFSKHGIDLQTFAQRLSVVKGDLAVECFKNEFLPALQQVFPQIGIKEIRHKRWRKIHRAFPNMKVVLTGRDPRDIYLSLCHKAVERKKAIEVGGPLTPANVAENLKQEFKHQMEMFRSLPCCKVRYEDFCTDSRVFRSIKAFVGSDIPDMGIIGQLSKYDNLVHGHRVTDMRVYRWKNEPDEGLCSEAQEVFDLLGDYCEFWGYEK